MIFILFLFVVSSVQSMSWNEYKQTFNKMYSNPLEDAKRKTIFMEKVAFINEYNSAGKSAKLGLNQFSDWTYEEKVQGLCGETGLDKKGYTLTEANMTEINSIKQEGSKNWFEEGAVTKIKDQSGGSRSNCGSCWAFASVAAYEGANFLKNQELVEYSEKHIVDCAQRSCEGGTFRKATQVAEKQGGIATSNCYAKYNGKQNKCQRPSCDSKIEFTSENVVSKRSLSDSQLEKAINQYGPLYFGMDTKDAFFDVKSDVYYCEDDNKERAGHAMAVIGYGEYEGKKYWLVKNSWGTSWGENGFGKIARGHRARCNKFEDISWLRL